MARYRAIGWRVTPEGLGAISRWSRSAPPEHVSATRFDPAGVTASARLRPVRGSTFHFDRSSPSALRDSGLMADNPFGMKKELVGQWPDVTQPDGELPRRGLGPLAGGREAHLRNT